MSLQHSGHKVHEELLIRVDEQDRLLGYETKAICHQGQGLLHRAFSIFIFNEQQQLLLQKRSAEKLLWPLYWSNSVCSHPRKGESYESATMRRLQEELGIRAPLDFLFRFQYQEPFHDIGSEHELCSVFFGKFDGPLKTNEHEIAEWRYISLDELRQELLAHPEAYTPWFKVEWERIQKEYLSHIEQS